MSKEAVPGWKNEAMGREPVCLHKWLLCTTRKGLAKWHAGIKTAHWDQLPLIPLSALSQREAQVGDSGDN